MFALVWCDAGVDVDVVVQVWFGSESFGTVGTLILFQMIWSMSHFFMTIQLCFVGKDFTAFATWNWSVLSENVLLQKLFCGKFLSTILTNVSFLRGVVMKPKIVFINQTFSDISSTLLTNGHLHDFGMRLSLVFPDIHHPIKCHTAITAPILPNPIMHFLDMLQMLFPWVEMKSALDALVVVQFAQIGPMMFETHAGSG